MSYFVGVYRVLQSPFELPPTPESAPGPNRGRSRRPRPARRGPWGAIANLLRLALLLGLGGAGVLGGVAAAQVFPGTITSQPPLETGLRTLDQWVAQLTRSTQPAAPIAATPRPLTPPSPRTVAPAALSPARRKALQSQLQALESDLNALIGEATAIEGELGTRNAAEPIERRVQAIAQALSTTAATPSAQPSPIATVSSGRLVIALPADLLFQDNHSNLRPEASDILDSIAADLKAYPGATVRIAGHSDAIGDPADNRELSLRRARAVGQFLADRLEGPYRWVAAGFGASRPIATGSDPASHQRNRRIEIAIDPLNSPPPSAPQP
ncbi:MAG TPA: OmpA family protein [Coleofasciculaceae cyanobacterium]